MHPRETPAPAAAPEPGYVRVRPSSGTRQDIPSGTPGAASGREADARWRARLSAVPPIGVCVTDGRGELIDVDPALAGYLDAGPSGVPTKPLSAFLHPADGPAFREALRVLGSGSVGEHRITVTLRPWHGPPRSGDLVGFTETASADPLDARVLWVLLAALRSGAEVVMPGEISGSDEFADEPPDTVAMATAFARLSALPAEHENLQRVLTLIAGLVKDAVPAAVYVSITMGPPSDPDRMGSDSIQAQDVDGLQFRVQQGPCWEAYESGSTVTSGDLTSDQRWPALVGLASDSAVRSALAIPLGVDDRVGVLNIYAERRHAFGPSNRRIGELVAASVAAVLHTLAERETLQGLAVNLEAALASRAVIDQAKGVLMGRLRMSPDEAFTRLVALSSRLNVKVRDLARLVVEGDESVIATMC